MCHTSPARVLDAVSRPLFHARPGREDAETKRNLKGYAGSPSLIRTLNARGRFVRVTP